MKLYLLRRIKMQVEARCHKARVLLFTALYLVGSACTPTEETDFNLAKKEADEGHYRIAVSHYEKVIARAGDSPLGVQAAREAARLSYAEIKDYRRSADFYRKLIVYSPDAEERLQAQRQIVNVFFDQLNDYPTAVIELNRLIPKLRSRKEIAHYKMNLAKAYFYQNNFTQAKNEVDEFLRNDLDDRQKFDMLILKTNILIATKDFESAILILKDVIKTYPDLSVKENVGLTLSVVYEELKDFKMAIQILTQVKEHHSTPEYIEMKIKRIMDRQKNAPGARGPRK